MLALRIAALALALALPAVANASAAPSSPLPFKIVDQRPFVDVSVNGHPARFLVDTGDGGRNAISRRLAMALQLTLIATSSISGANAGRLAVSRTVVDNFQFGAVAVHGAEFTVADFTQLERHIGFHMDGIVASATLANHRIRFDGPHRTVAVDAKTPLRGTAVPLRTVDGWPIVEATVDGIRGDFLIDTGDRSYLTLFTPFARAHYPHAKRTLRGVVTGFGLVAPIVTDLARTRLSVSGLVFPDVVTRLATQTRGGFASSALAGSIGFPTFLNTIVEFDYLGRKLTIAHSGSAPRSEWDHTGMWLSGSGAAIVIEDVISRSPAADAGLRVGDSLVLIDGRPARSVDLSALRSRLASAHPGVLRVTVRRNGRDIPTVVHPRSLV